MGSRETSESREGREGRESRGSRENRTSSQGPEAGGVLWQGHPLPGPYVRRLLLPSTLVSAALLVFGVVWEGFALSGHHLLAYPVAGVLFLALGVYGVAVRPLLLWRAAKQTTYTVGESGVEIRWGDGDHYETLFTPESLPPFSVRERSGGLDVVFGAPGFRESPWGWWKVREEGALFVAPDDLDGAVRALDRVRDLAGPTPTWTHGVVTPEDHSLVGDLLRRFRRGTE